MAVYPGSYGLLGAASGMLGASGPSRTPVGFGQVLGRGLSGYLSGLPMDLEEESRRKMQASLGRISDAMDPGLVKASWTSSASPIASKAGVPMTYLASLAKAESDNRNIPQNINSTGTAFGPFQFTQGTWNDGY